MQAIHLLLRPREGRKKPSQTFTHARTHTSLQVNLAVQEMLMDAAMGPEGIDFDEFCRLVREDSSESLASVHGLDLYDARWEQRGGALPDSACLMCSLSTAH